MILRYSLTCLLISFLSIFSVKAQVRVSLMDLKDTSSIKVNGFNGLLIYNTNSNTNIVEGYYYWKDTIWVSLIDTGNVGTQQNPSNFSITATNEGALAGNARGDNAVDLQTERNNAAQVASGLYSTISGGGQNTASNNSATVSGGRNNVASGTSSTVSGGNNNLATGGSSTISGGSNNMVAPVATVSGGQNNTASGYASSISGGIDNTASEIGSTVSGGDGNTASGRNSTVSGGLDNVSQSYGEWVGGVYNDTLTTGFDQFGFTATDRLFVLGNGTDDATRSNAFLIYKNGVVEAPDLTTTLIDGAADEVLVTKEWVQSNAGGGTSQNSANLTITANNTGSIAGNARGINVVDLQTKRNHVSQVASGDYATISGGVNNKASAEYATVSGGRYNTASGYTSTVAGGQSNTATKTNATVSGGAYNTAFEGYSAISGGRDNTASSLYSAVSGGRDNTASGEYSNVSGGYSNLAQSYGEWVGGLYNDTLTSGFNTTGFTATDRLFVLGNGTNDATRSNAFVIYKNGVVEAPDLTTTLIDGAADEVLVTKEWVQSNAGGGTKQNSTNFTITATNEGTVPGNARGISAVDLQTKKLVATQVAGGDYATISGGYSNTASAIYSTVSGGFGNIASGSSSTVSGGRDVYATGNYSVAPGGRGIVAQSYGELAAGIWNDTLPSSAFNRFSFQSNDRLFVLGNGMNAVSRSNAFVIYKNGLVTAPDLTNTLIENADSTVLTTRNYLDKRINEVGTVQNDGTLAITARDEGSVIGVARGFNAIDLQTSRTVASQVASGDRSIISGGDGNTALANFTIVAGGRNNTASGILATVSGGNTNKATGYNSTVSGGAGIIAQSYGEWVGGLYNDTATSFNSNSFNANDRLFVLGNGTASTRSNAFVIYKNGVVTAPDLTNTLIDGSDNSTLITKDWFYANRGVVQDPTNLSIVAKDEGSITGNSRGANAVDLQSGRLYQVQVASGSSSTISGGWNNKASGSHSTVSGGRSNEVSGQNGVVGGGSQNNVAGKEGVVSGGSYNKASATNSAVGGGYLNTASGIRSSILGGADNKSTGNSATVAGGYGNLASGDYSAVSGGNGTVAQSYGEWVGGLYNDTLTSGFNSTGFTSTDRLFVLGNGTPSDRSNAFVIYKNGVVEAPDLTTTLIDAAADEVLVTKEWVQSNAGGGTSQNSGNLSITATNEGTTAGNARGDNAVDLQTHRANASQVASGDNSTISGGWQNTASGGSSTVSGGYVNSAFGEYSSVSGGYVNTASEIYSAVSGGLGNTASGGSSTISGGWQNTSSGTYSNVSGGRENIASGEYSTVSGGRDAKARGNYSVVPGGRDIVAQSYGEFAAGVWNDTLPTSAFSRLSFQSNDRLFVLGNGMNAASRSNALVIYKNGNAELQGTLTANVASPSDERLKKNIVTLTGVLDKLTQVRGVSYDWIDSINIGVNTQGHDIGVVAQEINAVFPELVVENQYGYLTVNYAKLSAVLLQAVKEQKAEVDALNQAFAAFQVTTQNNLAALKADVTALKQQSIDQQNLPVYQSNQEAKEQGLTLGQYFLTPENLLCVVY